MRACTHMQLLLWMIFHCVRAHMCVFVLCLCLCLCTCGHICFTCFKQTHKQKDMHIDTQTHNLRTFGKRANKPCAPVAETTVAGRSIHWRAGPTTLWAGPAPPSSAAVVIVSHRLVLLSQPRQREVEINATSNRQQFQFSRTGF